MSSLPTRIVGGILVPDTPLITKALDYARAHLSDMAYNHVVRSWLFGFAIASKVPSFADRDLEVHSIAAILHDMGWDSTGRLVSSDKRFEVDGANVAREFLIKEGVSEEWEKHRLQLVWDAIALHTTPSIASHKEDEVQMITYGILTDFGGPDVSFEKLLTWEEWEGVVKEYPRLGLKDGVKDILCGLCRSKPETTYDNFVAGYGEKYVEGYSLEGKKQVDAIEAMTLP
ncbi:MAG: hypothetical protein Q9191_005544 [Dirinaria sp. TL-2023a]